MSSSAKLSLGAALALVAALVFLLVGPGLARSTGLAQGAEDADLWRAAPLCSARDGPPGGTGLLETSGGEEEEEEEEDGDDDDEESSGKKKGSSKDEKKSSGDSKTVADDPDMQFVKENLKEFLSPTSLRYLDDGRVELEFNFAEKSESHKNIFHIPIGDRLKDSFRWTIEDEEWVVGGEAGIRLSNKGIALLNVWFEDEVEAEVNYLQHINWTNRHTAAVIYAAKSGRCLGSNFGSQAALFSSGRMTKAIGEPQSVSFNSGAKIKLVVKEGTFEAHRNGRKKSELPYSQRSYASGRVGVLWSGSLSATVTSLTITGRIDYKTTAELIRKETKKRK